MRSRRLFLGTSAIVFAASAATTIAWGASMSSMGGMAMPGGWTMSHMWMAMLGQSSLGATASFVAMWAVMMVAMMLPSLTPTLLRYYDAVAATGANRAWLTSVVAVGYFVVWAALGAIVFPFGAGMAALVMRHDALSRAVPAVIGTVILLAVALQLSGWKRRHLAACQAAFEGCLTLETSIASAFHHGICLGVHCCCACAGIVGAMLALGVMDLRVMAAATVVITAERLGSRVSEPTRAGRRTRARSSAE